MIWGGTCAEPCFRIGDTDVCGDIHLPACSEILRNMIVSGRGVIVPSIARHFRYTCIPSVGVPVGSKCSWVHILNDPMLSEEREGRGGGRVLISAKVFFFVFRWFVVSTVFYSEGRRASWC